MDDINTVFQMLPSAQPKRIRGRWIPVDSYSAFGGDEATWMACGNPVAFYYCSECKKQAFAGEDGESLITDYCPNCGADMRATVSDIDDVTCENCRYSERYVDGLILCRRTKTSHRVSATSTCGKGKREVTI